VIILKGLINVICSKKSEITRIGGSKKQKRYVFKNYLNLNVKKKYEKRNINCLENSCALFMQICGNLYKLIWIFDQYYEGKGDIGPVLLDLFLSHEFLLWLRFVVYD
jgi:hypothetical protein